MKVFFACVAAATVLLSGCGNDKLKGNPNKYSKDPLTVAELCLAHLALEANGQQMCTQGHVMTGPELEADLVAYYCRPGTSYWTWASDLVKAVAESRVTIDWAKGRECLAVSRELRAELPGIKLYTDSRWAELKAGACASFFSGARGAGESCKEDWDCRGGLGCYTATPTIAGSKTCRAPAAVGASCDNEHYPCAPGSRCDESYHCSTTLLPDEEMCRDHYDCASGNCDATTSLIPMCAPGPGKKAIGQSCADDSECDPSSCVYCRATSAGGPQVCAIGGGEGEYCDDWYDCALDLGCTNHKCTNVAEGADCFGDTQAVCGKGLKCVANVDCAQYTDATACASNSYCVFDAEAGECGNGKGVCVKPPSSGACAYGNCAPHFYCDAGTDTCVAMAKVGQVCTDDGEGAPPCDGALTCALGVCASLCELDADCGEGKYCDLEADQPACKPYSTTTCLSTPECGPTSYCLTADVVCGAYATSSLCNADPTCAFVIEGDCSSAMGCDALTTQSGCVADADCQWEATMGCKASVDCGDITNETVCTGTAGCHYYTDYSVCGPVCYQFDSNQSGCNAQSSCTYVSATGYCEPKCDGVAAQADCSAITGCSWGEIETSCVEKFDCTALDATACQADSRCAFDDQSSCLPADEDAPGNCTAKIAIGQPVIGDCSLYDSLAGAAGSAESCQSGACVQDADGDSVCAEPAQYGCAGSKNIAKLVGLTFLFGMVLTRRRKR